MMQSYSDIIVLRHPVPGSAKVNNYALPVMKIIYQVLTLYIQSVAVLLQIHHNVIIAIINMQLAKVIITIMIFKRGINKL